MIEKFKLNVWKCQCERCSYEWLSQSSNKPKACNRCKSLYWNTPKEKVVKDGV